MSDQADFPTMDELMSRVGFLLLHWGWLENEFRAAGKKLPGQTDDTAFEFARNVRNLVAHGMHTASADPNRSAEAFIMCRSNERGEVRITFADLGRAIDALHARRVRAMTERD